jgi:hypothetical protein
MYLLRLSYLYDVREEQDLLIDMYRTNTLQNANGGTIPIPLPQFHQLWCTHHRPSLVQTRWHETDRTMVTCACNQTRRAGIKLQKHKIMSRSALQKLFDISQKVEDNINLLDQLSKGETSILLRGDLRKPFEFDALSEFYQSFEGFKFFKDENTEKYTGTRTPHQQLTSVLLSMHPFTC